MIICVCIKYLIVIIFEIPRKNILNIFKTNISKQYFTIKLSNLKLSNQKRIVFMLCPLKEYLCPKQFISTIMVVMYKTSCFK